MGCGEVVESVVLPGARSCIWRIDAGGIVACAGSADSHAGFNDSVVIIAVCWFRVAWKVPILLCDTCWCCGVQLLPSFRGRNDVTVYVRALPKFPACWRSMRSGMETLLHAIVQFIDLTSRLIWFELRFHSFETRSFAVSQSSSSAVSTPWSANF